MINPAALLKLKQDRDIFAANHPKFPLFLTAVQQTALQEDTIIEIKVTTKEGKTLNSNLKLTESDLALLQGLKDLI